MAEKNKCVPKNQKLDQGHKLIKEEKGGGTYTGCFSVVQAIGRPITYSIITGISISHFLFVKLCTPKAKIIYLLICTKDRSIL